MTTATLTCTDKTLKGELSLPSSKSISNRLLMIRNISRQGFRIHRLSDADDTRLLDQMMEQVACHVESADTLVLDTGNAGTLFRFLTAYLSTLPGEWMLTGSDRMKERPVQALVEALTLLGADIRYAGEQGYPPLIIRGGGLRGGEVNVEASVSSQYISSLLLVAPTLPGGLSLHLKGELVSYPYIAMTIRLMREYGIRVDSEKRWIRVFPGRYAGMNATVEADWSAASFWYEAAAMADTVELFLPGLREESMQGDAFAASFFRSLGVKTSFTREGAWLSRDAGSLNTGNREEKSLAALVDFSPFPDLAIPALTAWGFSGRAGSFAGLQNLKVKESDRYATLLQAVRKIGIPFRCSPDNTTLVFTGFDRSSLSTPHRLLLDSRDDHRMAMAFAMMALPLGLLDITHPESVSKSYPGFWKEFEKITGGKVLMQGDKKGYR